VVIAVSNTVAAIAAVERMSLRQAGCNIRWAKGIAACAAAAMWRGEARRGPVTVCGWDTRLGKVGRHRAVEAAQ